MNIQPVSLINFSAKTNNTNVSHKKSTLSQDSGKQTNNIDAKRLVNAMQALALSSAIAFTPAMVSCGKDEIEDCDHPNHINPPYPGDSTDIKPDTVYLGKTYEVPEISMRRYKVENNDTTYIGNVTFSPGIVHVPYNAHKSSELQTVLKFIDALGLQTQNLNNEYTATKAFDYNVVPAQLTWLNEKTGTVNQLKYNGYDSQDKLVKMDLISIPADSEPFERQLELIVAGNDKLLVSVYDKDGENKYTEQLFTLDNDTITQFNINENNNFQKVFEYSKGNNPTSVSVKDANGNQYKLANFDVLTAISEEK